VQGVRNLQIARELGGDPKVVSILLVVVVAATLVSTGIVGSISRGAQAAIYDTTIAFFPHARISCRSSEQAMELAERLDSGGLVAMRVSWLLGVELSHGAYAATLPICVVHEPDSRYLRSLLPILCENPKVDEPASEAREAILETVRVARGPWSEGRGAASAMLLGDQAAKSLRASAGDRDGNGRSWPAFEWGGEPREYRVTGIMSSLNSELRRLCVINATGLSWNDPDAPPAGARPHHQVFVRTEDPSAALEIQEDHHDEIAAALRAVEGAVEDDLEYWTEHDALTGSVAFSRRIARAFGLINSSNWVLALIAEVGLVSLALRHRTREISIVLFEGRRAHRQALQVFGTLLGALFACGCALAAAGLALFDTVHEDLLGSIPYHFEWTAYVRALAWNLATMCAATLASYYAFALAGDRLPVDL